METGKIIFLKSIFLFNFNKFININARNKATSKSNILKYIKSYLVFRKDYNHVFCHISNDFDNF